MQPIVVLLTLCAVSVVYSRPIPIHMDSTGLMAMQGLWFQTHQSALMEATAPGLYCITSYLEIRQTLLSIPETFFTEWAANVGAPDGPLSIAYGSLTQHKHHVPPIAEFHTAHPVGTDCRGSCELPTWMTTLTVIAASEIDAESGRFSWVVITDPQVATLAIHARDVDHFVANHQAKVLSMLDTMGLGMCLTTPIPVHQGSDCVYGIPSNFPTSRPHALSPGHE